MCDGASALAAGSLLIGTVTAASSYSAKQQDASAARAYQAQERYNAEVDRNYNYNQLSLRQMQEHDAATQAMIDNSIRAVTARAAADTSAAENGVEGNSVESVARNFYREQGRIDAATEKNASMSVQQLQSEKDSVASKYRSRTNFSPVRDPSVLDLALGIGGAAVGAYDLYDRRNQIRGRSKD